MRHRHRDSRWGARRSARATVRRRCDRRAGPGLLGLLLLVSPLTTTLVRASSDPPLLERLRPLYRWSVPSSTAHLYGVLPDAPRFPGNVRREGAEGDLLAIGEPGTAPLVALADPARTIVLFTARPSARRDLVGRAAFREVAVVGHLFTEPGPGRVALRALWSPAATDQILTTSEDEVARLTAPSAAPSYLDLGVEGFVAPYFAVGEPAGAAEGKAPRGVMLVIHGGAWQDDGEASVEAEANRAEADRWRARGWRTVAVSHRPSREGPADAWPAFFGETPPVVPGSAERSIEDVVWFYDRVREWVDDSVPICATGWSSGGHLALLLAARRPELACVVGQAAPTDLRALAGTVGGAAATFAFGPLAQDDLSPTRHASSIRALVLLATATDDLWVPVAQIDLMRRAMARAGSAGRLTALRLGEGETAFWHGFAAPAAIARFHREEERLAARALREHAWRSN